MPLTQEHIGPDTPMGATHVRGGATVRVWAPRARAVHVVLPDQPQPTEANRLVRGPAGHWTGFVPGLVDGSLYRFHVVGLGGSGRKRDPYARELTTPFIRSDCIVRDPGTYPWHDGGFRPPAFNDLSIYELHIGAFTPSLLGGPGGFLDLLTRLDHLVALGVTAVELMPIVEFPSEFSEGYNGTDYFSPEMDYVVYGEDDLDRYLALVNALLARAGRSLLEKRQLRGAVNQLKAMVDVLHVYGLAVLFDVVYNHAGGGFDDESIHFFDRAPQGDNNDSLYFTDQGHAGGLVFAFWRPEVRQFLIDNALYYVDEYHVDGFRYDRMEVPVHSSESGWHFCQSLTGTVRHRHPSVVQISEYWPPDPWAVKDGSEGGAGFDATWQNTLRYAVRGAITQASGGSGAHVDLDRVAGALRDRQLSFAWKEVHCIENHDEVRDGRDKRIPALADGADATSWFARSRSRVALGLLMTAPGIPLLFMGQELLDGAPWSDRRTLRWELLERGVHADFLRYTRDLAHVRRFHAGLRGESCNVFHVHNDNRVLAFHRWREGTGDDVVVVVSLNDHTFPGYDLGFPAGGAWWEVLNSDAYDSWPNPLVAGNRGIVHADGPPLHGLPRSATVTIPANAVLVFVR